MHGGLYVVWRWQKPSQNCNPFSLSIFLPNFWYHPWLTHTYAHTPESPYPLLDFNWGPCTLFLPQIITNNINIIICTNCATFYKVNFWTECCSVNISGHTIYMYKTFLWGMYAGMAVPALGLTVYILYICSKTVLQAQKTNQSSIHTLTILELPVGESITNHIQTTQEDTREKNHLKSSIKGNENRLRLQRI